MSLTNKIKQWLFQENKETRRAPRSTDPDVVVYYWDGSAPEGRYIRDVSPSGAYIYTPERWYLGTIVRFILQGYPGAVRPDGTSSPAASISIPARVVRHGTDGVAVEFAFRDQQEEERCRAFLATIPIQPPRTMSAQVGSPGDSSQHLDKPKSPGAQ